MCLKCLTKRKNGIQWEIAEKTDSDDQQVQDDFYGPGGSGEIMWLSQWKNHIYTSNKPIIESQEYNKSHVHIVDCCRIYEDTSKTQAAKQQHTRTLAPTHTPLRHFNFLFQRFNKIHASYSSPPNPPSFSSRERPFPWGSGASSRRPAAAMRPTASIFYAGNLPGGASDWSEKQSLAAVTPGVSCRQCH